MLDTHQTAADRPSCYRKGGLVGVHNCPNAGHPEVVFNCPILSLWGAEKKDYTERTEADATPATNTAPTTRSRPSGHRH